MSTRIIAPIDQCGAQDLPELLRLSRAQEWPHEEEDWRTILASGEVFGHRSGTKEMLSCAAMIPYGDSGSGPLIALGMIIVDSSARRQGLGQALMQEAIRRASSSASPSPLRLISTRDGRPLYEKHGFITVENLYSYRRPATAPLVAPPNLKQGQELRLLDASLRDVVIALDTSAFGYNRDRMLEQRIAQMERGRVLFDGATPVGYGLLVRQGNLANLGPVVAPDDAGALTVINGLMSTENEGTAFRIDLPARQKALFPALESLGFAEKDVPPIMVRSSGETQASNALGGAQRHYYGIAAQVFG